MFIREYKVIAMQYTVINGCKNEKKIVETVYVFLIFAENIDCGYTLEPPH